MPSASPPKIAQPWAIPKLLAPVAMASNAPLATNGLAVNQRPNFAMNTASPSPAPEPTKPEESAKLAMVNIITVLAPMGIHGTQLIKYVNMIIKPTVSSGLYTTVTVLARKIKLALRLCSVWLFMKNQPARWGGL